MYHNHSVVVTAVVDCAVKRAPSKQRGVAAILKRHCETPQGAKQSPNYKMVNCCGIRACARDGFHHDAFVAGTRADASSP